MNKTRITLLIAFAYSYAGASSVDVISKMETTQMKIPEVSIEHYADNISLAANAGWQRMSNGRVRAGNGFIERFIYFQCKEQLALIDAINKSPIHASKINRYCSGLNNDMDNPATHLALENIKNSLYLTLVGTNGKLDVVKFTKYNKENRQYKQPELTLNPQTKNGLEFTTSVVECIAKINAVEVLDHNAIKMNFSRDVSDRDLCVVDKNYGNKVISAFLESVERANK